MPLTKSRSSRLKAILLIGGLTTLQPLATDPYLPSMTAVSNDLSVPLSIMQLTLSALTLGFAVGQLAAGPLSDSIGRKRPMAISVAVYILASILCAFAPNPVIFFIARLLQGLSGAAITVIANAIMRDMYTGLALIKLMGRVMLVGAAAWFIGPFIGSKFLEFTDWRGISLILAGFAALVGLLALKFLPESLSREDRRDHIFAGMGHRFVNVLRDRSYTGILIIQITIGVAMFAYLSTLPIVFNQGFGVPSTAVGFFIAINSVGAFLGVQSGAQLSRLVPAQWVLTGAIALGILAGSSMFLGGQFGADLWFIELMAFIWTFAFGNTTTTALTLAMAPHGEEAGTAAALLGSASFLFTTLAGPFYTTLSKENPGDVGATIAISMVVALIVMFAVVRPNKLVNLK